MTIEKLLEVLRKKREQLDFSISAIESELDGNKVRVKRKAIVKEVKKKHWMQDPKNHAKMMRNIRKMRAANKARSEQQ